MLKILIVENNKIECKEMVNCIAQSDLNVKIYSIAYTGEEAISILKCQNVDLVILDCNFEDISKENFFSILYKEHIEKYKNSIILLSDFNEKSFNKEESIYIFNYLKRPVEQSQILKSIRNYLKQKNNNNLKYKICKELDKLHFKFSYNGTQYLVETIYEICLRNYICDVNLSKDIFPILSNKYNKSINTIHSNIKKTISIMFYDCDESTLKEYFNYYELEKPKLKELIFKVIDHMRI